jgi:phosphoglycerate dehydrogenase-like enzyme
MNKTIPHHNWMVNGKWRTGDEDAESTPLRRRKVGLLGYGAVNSKVHRFLSGFNVEFLILKRTWKNEDKDFPTKFQKFTPSQLHLFLEHVDILIVAVPLTSATMDLIGKKELQLLGSAGLLINMSRGIVVNQKDLFESLKDGIIAGAAIDVWYNYRPDPDSEGKKYPYNYPFHELVNIVLSPHRGYSPYDDLERWNEVVENIERYVSGRTDFINVVRLERGY